MDKTVAVEILKQLGGNRFIIMTGASNFGSMDNGLVFKLPSFRSRLGINYVKIVLNAMDTHDVTFYKVRGLKMTQISSFEGIYNDNLVMLFEGETGLRTSLGLMQGGVL